MVDNKFSNGNLNEEEAFWVMFYFLDYHYELSGGQFEVSDILSASQPFEFNEDGTFDGEVHGNHKYQKNHSSDKNPVNSANPENRVQPIS